MRSTRTVEYGATDGRFDEALMVADRALAQDPASVLAIRDKAGILFLARRYEDCVTMCLKTLELDPFTPLVHGRLGRAYEQLGRHREAVDAYITPLTFAERNRDTVAGLRAAAALGGIKGFWQERLRHLLNEPDGRAYSIAWRTCASAIANSIVRVRWSTRSRHSVRCPSNARSIRRPT